MNIRFGEMWDGYVPTPRQMLREASGEVNRWYRYDADGLAGLGRNGVPASSRLLYQTVESLKTAVNRHNHVLEAIVRKNPGILDELA